MYLEHFGLAEFPFSLAPDPRYLYLSDQHREALAHLLYGVMHEGGFVQLTGEVGTGKTTVCRTFLERLPEGTDAAVILNPRLSAEELVAAVCDEFRIPPGSAPATVKGSLDRLNAFLIDTHARGRGAVLVVDEAQNLDAGALETVRLLTNLETSRRKLLQIVLMGQPELRATLARPELRQLAQRVTARFHLGSLSCAETEAYLRHRLKVAGCRETLFPLPVARVLWRLSGGVPRKVNILADRALLGAFVQGRRQVDAATVRRAAREVGGEMGRPWWRRRSVALAGAATVAVLAGIGLSFRGDPPAQDPAPAPPAALAPRETPVPAALLAILAEPESRIETEAWKGLFRVWGLTWSEAAREDPCAEARRSGLLCLAGGGDWRDVLRMNAPGIVRLRDRDGTAWLLLERSGGGKATIAAGGSRTFLDTAGLEGFAVDGYVVLARPQEAAAEPAKGGARVVHP